MDTAIEIDSDISDPDDETDTLLQEYLNDNRVESVQARTTSQDLIYTPKQLEDIALYKNAIALNRETEATYKKLEDSLIKMLTEVRKKLKENEAALVKQSRCPNEGGFNYLRCGKPYFKDKSNFPAPDNDDTILMRQAQMYDFSQMTSVPGWTAKDKTQFINTILEFSRDIKKNELRAQISELRKQDSKDSLMEIVRLEREITQLYKKSLKDIALPIDQDYDWEDLAISLNRRHTAQEYRSLWKLFFHPSINKSNWSRIEHQDLQRIAQAHNMQDWDVIAEKLKTGRTGYQCYVYYRSNMYHVDSNNKWTAEEIEYLQRVIDYFREGTYIPWGKVATAMDGRTKIQVYNKYTRMLERRKGRFLEEEDVVLLNCYEKYGDDFRKIAEFLPGRSAVQIKTRFNLLTKFRLSTTWTVEEDRKLIQIMANLDSNSSYSNATRHFPGKDRINIRSRYVTLMRWMKAHPTADISLAPRRGARRLLHGHAPCDLKDAIANLNRRMEIEVDTKKRAKITRDSTEKEIEDGIMAALVNEIITHETTRKIDRSELGDMDVTFPSQSTSKENKANLKKLLIFLNASLDKTVFENSKYATQYPQLIETVPIESLVKVKSYSKSNTVQTIEINDHSDIWSENAGLKHSTYVLPPNYDTITGLRVLAKHYGTKPEKTADAVDLGMKLRKNEHVKEAMDKLKERFKTLFLWPILLSNELPSKNMNRPYVSKLDGQMPSSSQKVYLPNPTSLHIPTLKKKRALPKNSADTEEIDVPKQRKLDLSRIQCPFPTAPTRMGILNSDEDSLLSETGLDQD